MSKKRGPAFVFIFITMLLDMLAIGIVIPVLPQLVLRFLHGETAAATQVFGIFGTVFALMQFVAMPVLGVVSDRFGRRPVILISNFGLGLDYVIMALAPTIGWLFLGRVIAGITAASIVTAYAYVIDITKQENRAGSLAMLNGAFGLGFIIGPAVGGLLGSIDLRLPFWVAAGMSLANGFYGLFVLPESLAREKRQPRFEWKRANPIGSLKLLRSHPELLGLAGVMFLAYLAHESFNTFVLYGNYRYGWDAKAIGLTLAIVGVCSASVQMGLVRRVVSAIGERRALMTGLAFGAAGFAVFASAPLGPILWAGIPLIALWGFATPSAQGLMAPRVSPSEQGQLQGAIGSVRGIAMLFGPGLMSLTFATFIGPLRGWQIPGAAFYLAGLFLACAVALAAYVTRGTPARRITAAEAEVLGPSELLPIEEAP